LEAYGFDRSKPAFISWLGVVWYLGERAFIDVLHEVATLAAGSELVFEYPIPMHLVDPEDRPLVQLVRQIGASRGEPMLCAGYDPAALVMRVEALGFTKVLDLSPRDIQVLYFMGREDRLRMPGIGHFMAAQR
jgi:O-methyltransferase involved in polyketide biosynthesis